MELTVLGAGGTWPAPGGGTAGYLVLALAEGWTFSRASHVGAMILGCTLVGLYGTRVYRRLQRAEISAERERAAAVASLAAGEARRERLERMAVVGRLAAGLAHEVNNPLSVIKGNVDYLRRGSSPQDAETSEVFDEMRDATERIRRIVASLGTFARGGAGASEPCRLDGVLEDAIQLARLRTKTVAALNREVPRDLPAVLANRERLVEILVNLLINAADAIEEAASRSGQKLPAGRVRVWARADAGEVEIGVDDSGPGIPDEILPRIFDPFFTTKEPGKGTGMGLTVAREQAEQWGGSLTAGRAPEGGARLVVRLRAVGT